MSVFSAFSQNRSGEEMTTKDVKTCSRCNSRRLLMRCEGCESMLCHSHALEHRNELTRDWETIAEQHKRLHSIFVQHEQRNEHPLFDQIEVWKHESIKKIRLAAEKARHDLLLLLTEDKQRTKVVMEKFTNSLKTAKEEDLFTEHDLNSWKEELIKIKAQLEMAVNIELVQDRKASPIQLIKIRTRKETPLVSVSETRVTTVETVVEEVKEILPVEQSCPAVGLPEEQVQSKEDPTEAVQTESPKLLYPKKNKTLLLHGSQMNMPLDFSLKLKKFAGDHLEIFNNFDDANGALSEVEQACIIFYLSIEESEPMLVECAKYQRLHSVYIRDKLPESKEKLMEISKKYPKVRGIAENDLSLLSRWVMDSAGDYRMHADLWIAQGDKDKARDCFQQSIDFVKSLSQLLKERKRGH